MTNKIQLTCSGCGLVMLVPQVYVGKKVRCKRCKALIPIEHPVEETQSAEEKSEDWLDGEMDAWGHVAARSYDEESSLPPRPAQKTSRPPAAAVAAVEISTETCPLPGLLLGHFLTNGSKQGFIRSPSTLSQIVGYGYLLIALAMFISSVTFLVRTGGESSTILLRVLVMLLSGLFLVVLHYANHTCEQLSGSMLRSPKFYVASMGHLQLAAVPFVLLAIAVAIVALPMAVSVLVLAFAGEQRFGVFDRLSELFTPLLLVFLSTGVCRLFLGVLLNPAKVGIEVNPDASAAETTLAITAAVARAPLSIVAPIHQSGVVAGCIGACISVVFAAGVSHELIFVASAICWLWGLGALVWPIFAYGSYFISMFGIEILQSFFQLSRNVAAIAKQNQREDRL